LAQITIVTNGMDMPFGIINGGARGGLMAMHIQ